MRKSHHSLHGLLRRSLLRSVVCMILPVCVLAGLLVVLTQRYDADIALTTRASEVRTVLVQDLPDEVWNVVSGRISFEDGRQRMLIDSALWELNDMLDSAGEDEAQYLNAALRAIRTISRMRSPAWAVSTPEFSTDWVRQRLHSLRWSA